MDDMELIERCKCSDPDAWNVLVKKYWNDVYRIVYRLVFDKEIAKDITQEIFLKLMDNIKIFDVKRGNFRSWLNSISKNYTIDYLRKNKMRLLQQKEDVSELCKWGVGSEVHEDPYLRLRRYEKKEFLRSCLMELKEDYRTVIVMRDIENLSYEEMVEVLGIPLGTLKSRLNRARIELAKIVLSRKKSIGE